VRIFEGRGMHKMKTNLKTIIAELREWLEWHKDDLSFETETMRIFIEKRLKKLEDFEAELREMKKECEENPNHYYQEHNGIEGTLEEILGVVD